MAKGAVLSLKITGDASSAKAALNDVEDHSGKLGDGLGKLAGIAAGAFAVDKIVDFGKAAFDAASNLEQSSGAMQTVFGDLSDQMNAASEDALNWAGLSSNQFNELSTVLGSQLKNAGYAGQQLADTTEDLIGKGADMSAVFGGSAADAVEALSSALKGEMDPIEKYGVSLNQAAIDAQATADGAHKINGAWSAQAKAAAVLALVNKQTAQTVGQFGAQSGTAAEKAQHLSAWFENLQAKIGAGLLPIFVTLTTFFSDKVGPALDKIFIAGGPVATVFGQVGTFLTGTLVPALSSLWNELGPKLVPILQDVGGFLTGFVVPAFQMLGDYISRFVIPTFRNILGPIISGIGTVFHTVTAKIMEHKDTFVGLYTAIQPFLAFIRDKVAPVIGGAFRIGFEVAGKAIGFVVDVIAKIVDSIKWLLDKGAAVGRFIGKLFGAGDSGGGGGGGAPRGSTMFGAARSGGGRLFGAAGSLGGGGAGPSATAGGLIEGGTVVNITVNGALDPLSVARQIRDLLDTYTARTGGSVAVRLA